MINIVARDLFLNALAFCLLALIILLPHINVPTVDAKSTEPPGQLSVSIAWPEGSVDVDLWMMGPGEKKAVGYSNRGGRLLNLLRDDLGTSADDMPLNFENGYSRGLPAGEYTVNIHLYRGAGPVPVSVEIRFGPTGEKATLFLQEVITLAHEGQERTVISFRLDAQGRVVGANRVFKPLRAAGT